jgi:hypothetical protein
MLKIKDNVDLKELEKFGFKLLPKCFEPAEALFEDTYKANIKIRITTDRIIYPVDDEDIYNLGNENAFKMYDTLYDLIKADLVEKVEDEGE